MDCLGCRIANGIEPDVNIVYEMERRSVCVRRGTVSFNSKIRRPLNDGIRWHIESVEKI
ncbi:hypothetical protein SAMN05216378_0510 [Paenibacillus catalpae]|uniref:Uncharacterized protein n=1 Tax=Paenibacillus catalpae TaxID=1045775 RepID=A0A1I1TH84_9BACL|nr:hypothetical protein SAMN05216378_0510 [Paenibacillus catalpae]